jgi:hypothetical protein
MRLLAGSILLLASCDFATAKLRVRNLSSEETRVVDPFRNEVRLPPGEAAPLPIVDTTWDAELRRRGHLVLEIRRRDGVRQLRLTLADLDLLGWTVPLP